jgi:signal transduction histidine kinase
VQRETAGGPPQETGAIVRADPKHANPARSTIWPLAARFLLTPQDPGAALAPVPDLTQLDTLIEEVRSAGLETTLEVHGQAPDVPAGVQLTVYRLVQEALTNTLKHGGAGARVTVRLRYLPGELQVDIDDDGAGATAPAPAGVGGGLIGMHERVHAYGGDVQAGPRQPGGWKVSARLRLDGDVPSF